MKQKYYVKPIESLKKGARTHAYAQISIVFDCHTNISCFRRLSSIRLRSFFFECVHNFIAQNKCVDVCQTNKFQSIKTKRIFGIFASVALTITTIPIARIVYRVKKSSKWKDKIGREQIRGAARCVYLFMVTRCFKSSLLIKAFERSDASARSSDHSYN